MPDCVCSRRLWLPPRAPCPSCISPPFCSISRLERVFYFFCCLQKDNDNIQTMHLQKKEPRHPLVFSSAFFSTIYGSKTLFAWTFLLLQRLGRDGARALSLDGGGRAWQHTRSRWGGPTSRAAATRTGGSLFFLLLLLGFPVLRVFFYVFNERAFCIAATVASRTSGGTALAREGPEKRQPTELHARPQTATPSKGKQETHARPTPCRPGALFIASWPSVCLFAPAP